MPRPYIIKQKHRFGGHETVAESCKNGVEYSGTDDTTDVISSLENVLYGRSYGVRQGGEVTGSNARFQTGAYLFLLLLSSESVFRHSGFVKVRIC